MRLVDVDTMVAPSAVTRMTSVRTRLTVLPEIDPVIVLVVSTPPAGIGGTAAVPVIVLPVWVNVIAVMPPLRHTPVTFTLEGTDVVVPGTVVVVPGRIVEVV